MRRIERLADRMRGTITYELDGGRHLTVRTRDVREFGLAEVLRAAGLADQIPSKRVNVVRRGRVIGTVPGDFDDAAIRSKNFLYDPRPGDFRREEDHWVASDALGAGDLAAVVGFVPNLSE